MDRLLADPEVGSVVSVARRPLPAPTLAAHRSRLSHVQADFRSTAAREALAHVDVLFHLGFQLWMGSGGGDAMAAANRDGTANVLAARPSRVVLASSAAVYGAWPDNPLPLCEDDPARPNLECPYAAQKLAAERACQEAAPTVVLRIGAVLGEHADRWVAKALAGYRHLVPAIRGVRQASQFVDEADVADAFIRAGRRAMAGVLNVATSDWLDAPALAALSGGKVVALPRAVLLGLSEAARRCRLLPFGADRAVLIDGPLALDNTRAGQELGWHPQSSSHDVLARALRRPAGEAVAPGVNA